jgi:hypothetical protein
MPLASWFFIFRMEYARDLADSPLLKRRFTMKKTLLVSAMLLGASTSFAKLPTPSCSNGFEVQVHFSEDDKGNITANLTDNFITADLTCKLPEGDFEQGGDLSKMVCRGNWVETAHQTIPVVVNLTRVHRSNEDSKLLASFVRHPFYTGLPIAIVCE